MNKIKSLMITAALTSVLAACGSSEAAGPDLSKALERTSAALTTFQTDLKSKNIEKVTDAHMTQMANYMQAALNTQPPIHTSPIGIKVEKDSSFIGFNDPNKNNVLDSGEKKLFKIQIDFEGKRLIATEEKSGGSSVGMGLAGGMLAGMLMGRLMGNQRAAGVAPGSLANKKVQSRSAYSSSRAAKSRRSSPARSRARSGGRFSGK